MEFGVQTTTEGNFAGLLTLARQIRFAAAAAITATVKQAQLAAIAKIKETFITRNPWYEPTNYLGVHFKPATPDDLTGELSTNAWFLVPHELGGIKTPIDHHFLAIPTSAIQPDIRQAVPRQLRPRNLNDAFVLNTRRGPKLFERINHQLRLVYNLVEQVHVRKQSTIIEPAVEIVEKNFLSNFRDKLQEALRTAK
jgi:hypothetical protein